MEISSRRKVWIFLLVLLMTCACTDSNEKNGSDTEILSSVLFMPEDLDDGWYVDTYTQFTQPTDFDSIEAIGAFIQAEPGSFEGRYQDQPSRYHAGQSLYIYQDEAMASLAAENIRQFLAATQFGIKPQRPFDITYESQLDIINAGCRSTEVSEVGSDKIEVYYGCIFTVQHGRYISNSSMAVDGELITMEDWQDFINAIQVRLIEQVAGKNEE